MIQFLLLHLQIIFLRFDFRYFLALSILQDKSHDSNNKNNNNNNNNQYNDIINYKSKQKEEKMKISDLQTAITMIFISIIDDNVTFTEVAVLVVSKKG